MSWNAWGVFWGDSWGTSWGPIHEVEEHPEQYYGNGRRRHVAADQFSDADLERMVREKWEAIEAAQKSDVETPANSGDSKHESTAEAAAQTDKPTGYWPPLALPIQEFSDPAPIILAPLRVDVAVEAGAIAHQSTIDTQRKANDLAILMILDEV